MKLKRLILAFLIFFPLSTACAAFSTTSPPTPAVKFPFYVSKKDSTVNQEFQIREYRSYYFALRFEFSGQVDGQRVLVLVGNGTSYYPGIGIPIHLKIFKLDSGSLPPELLYEDAIMTEGKYAAAFEKYLREIIAIDLKPGIYRVEANTLEDRPEFSVTPSYLQIEPHSQIKFLPGSIK